MTIDATFWVMISFFAFIGLLIYFKIPQKIKTTLEENIKNIKNQIDEADKLKEDAKNILTEHERKISNSKAEVKEMREYFRAWGEQDSRIRSDYTDFFKPTPTAQEVPVPKTGPRATEHHSEYKYFKLIAAMHFQRERTRANKHKSIVFTCLL